MPNEVESARRSAIRALTAAYATGAVSTATLERRIERALSASRRSEVEECVWDVPRARPWWRRRAGSSGRLPSALVVEDDGAELAFAISAPGSFAIGRHESCDIRIANTSVSRRHAVVSRRGDVCRIRDLGSSNGTTVNGVPIDVCDLEAGDRLELGEVLIRVR